MSTTSFITGNFRLLLMTIFKQVSKASSLPSNDQLHSPKSVCLCWAGWNVQTNNVLFAPQRHGIYTFRKNQPMTSLFKAHSFFNEMGWDTTTMKQA